MPNYQKVFNFDIQKNENYYVSLDGILVHNGYGSIDEAEDLGSHSIKRHGAHLTDEDMLNRIMGNHPDLPQSRTAMKFDSNEIHQKAVDATFDANKAEIDKHFANGGGYKEFEYDFGSQVGTGYTNNGTLRNPDPQKVTSNKLKIAMDPTGDGGYKLVSAYPSYP